MSVQEALLAGVVGNVSPGGPTCRCGGQYQSSRPYLPVWWAMSVQWALLAGVVGNVSPVGPTCRCGGQCQSSVPYLPVWWAMSVQWALLAGMVGNVSPVGPTCRYGGQCQSSRPYLPVWWATSGVRCADFAASVHVCLPLILLSKLSLSFWYDKTCFVGESWRWKIIRVWKSFRNGTSDRR